MIYCSKTSTTQIRFPQTAKKNAHTQTDMRQVYKGEIEEKNQAALKQLNGRHFAPNPLSRQHPRTETAAESPKNNNQNGTAGFIAIFAADFQRPLPAPCGSLRAGAY